MAVRKSFFRRKEIVELYMDKLTWIVRTAVSVTVYEND